MLRWLLETEPEYSEGGDVSEDLSNQEVNVDDDDSQND